MDFSFGRNRSKDEEGEEDKKSFKDSFAGITEGGAKLFRRLSLSQDEEGSSSIKDSITEGSSRFLGSLGAKKDGLFNGISGITNKFDQVLGNKGDDQLGTTPPQLSPKSPPGSQQRTPERKPSLTRGDGPPPRPPPIRQDSRSSLKGPPKPPPPKFIKAGANGNVKQYSVENQPGSPPIQNESQLSGSPRQEKLPDPVAPTARDDSDADSEATEGCDDIVDPSDFDIVDASLDMFRTGSVGSDQDWTEPNENNMDPQTAECVIFMRHFVNKIFMADSGGITQADKSKFGQLCQQAAGRLWFSRYITVQRTHNKRVNEQVFYQLVQHFAIALFECHHAEDYNPAKSLMNMCFTFYHEENKPGHPLFKHFLYSFLKDQPIWQSLRFWNAAFFDAVQCERARKPVPTSGAGSEARIDDRSFQQNITFGQLGTFTCNMRAFGLNKELCYEFLRKQATIANLKDDQVRMVKENIDRWRD